MAGIEALVVARTLAVGLGRAHRAGLVHRDVKPSNLLLATEPGARPADAGPAAQTLLRSDERLLLSDMGFGKDLLASSGLTVGGGTYGFAAPEQRAAQGTVDTRADIHAASALLYWLFTRRTPPDDGADLHLSRRLPPSLVPVLGQGLATDPEQRLATIDEWYALVAVALDPSGASAPLAGPVAEIGSTRGPSDPAVVGPEHDPAFGGISPGPAGRGSLASGEPSARPRRRLATMAVLAVGLLAGAAGAVALDAAVDDGPTIERQTDGTQIVSAERDGLRLSVSGPETVTVGDQIELSASSPEALSIDWFAPAGGRADGNDLTLNAERTGVASITAVAADDLGRTVAVEFQVMVTASG